MFVSRYLTSVVIVVVAGLPAACGSTVTTSPARSTPRVSSVPAGHPSAGSQRGRYHMIKPPVVVLRRNGSGLPVAADVYVRLNRAVQPRASMVLRVVGYPVASDEPRGYDGRSRRGNCYTGSGDIVLDPAGGLQDLRVGKEVSVDVSVNRRSQTGTRQSRAKGRAVVVAGPAGENSALAGEPSRYRRLGCSGSGYAMSFPDR